MTTLGIGVVLAAARRALRPVDAANAAALAQAPDQAALPVERYRLAQPLEAAAAV